MTITFSTVLKLICGTLTFSLSLAHRPAKQAARS